MSIFAISDLHLSKVNPKPMNIFGENWDGHWEKIKSDWKDRVGDEDTVLIPGDISWAMSLDEALPDLMDISELPGRKLLLKGNHDYWWASLSKINKVLPHNMHIIQNNHVDVEDYYVCGTRGWMLPEDDRFKDEDMKVYNRELIRLEISLSGLPSSGCSKAIVMLHYPPVYEIGRTSGFVELMKKYNVDICLYGHLHGDSLKRAVEGNIEGIDMYMVSCDYLNFKLKKII